MPEIKTGNRKDDTRLPFKICSGKFFFLTHFANLRQDKLPVFMFLSPFCFKTVICTGFKMATLQHRLSKIGGESFPPFHAVTVTTIWLQRIRNKRDLLNYMESEFRITCPTFYAVITVRQLFFISISASYRQAGGNRVLDGSVLWGYCAFWLGDLSGITEIWTAPLRKPNKTKICRKCKE